MALYYKRTHIVDTFYVQVKLLAAAHGNEISFLLDVGLNLRQ